MMPSQAADLVAELQAAYPGREFRAGSGKLFAQTLLAYDQFDGQLAIAELIETSPRPPAIAELLVALKSVRRQRFDELEREQVMALPDGEQPTSLTDWVRSQPDGMQKRIEKLGAWAETLRIIAAEGNEQTVLEKGGKQ